MNLHKPLILQTLIYNKHFKGYIMLPLILSIDSNEEDCIFLSGSRFTDITHFAVIFESNLQHRSWKSPSHSLSKNTKKTYTTALHAFHGFRAHFIR